jgi:hypothetical protein
MGEERHGMTVLRFDGIVESEWRITVEIDGRDVINEIHETWPTSWHEDNPPRVTAALADERFEGDLLACHGSEGYSEWTPGDVGDLRVGEHDLFDRLDELDGQQVTLWIADEPVNVLEQKGAQIVDEYADDLRKLSNS